MEKLIIDTSYFIAYLNKRDKHHQEALALSKKLEAYEAVITDYIFDELVTFLAYHVNRNYAVKVANEILNKVDEGELTLHFVDHETFKDALNYFSKYDGLSFTDCTTLSLMDKLGTQFVLTFDRGFDNVTLVGLKKPVINVRYL